MNYSIDHLLDTISIEKINPDTNFWLIRTDSGNFYEEYVKEGYVALGWNIVDKDLVSKVMSHEQENNILNEISVKYNTKAPRLQYNKCINFIYTMKPNDILMIPSNKSSKITFAIAGEYYEENFDYSKEVEIKAQIHEGFQGSLNLKCPYKKRRKIRIVKTVMNSNLNVNLYKALISVHGLSNINNYAPFVLSSMYNLYVCNDTINYVFNVRNENDISLIEISNFITSFYEIVKFSTNETYDINNISGKININSPGDILISLQNLGSNFVEFINSYKLIFLIIYLSIGGGRFKFFGIELEMKSFIQLLMDWKSNKIDNRKKELQNKILEKAIESFNHSSKKLKIDSTTLDNIIDLSKYFNEENGQSK